MTEDLLSAEELPREIEHLAERVPGTLLILDFNGFHLVNDRYGRAAGDKLISRFAELVRAMVRTNDPAGHLAGDAFAVYLQQVTAENILQSKVAAFNRELTAAIEEILGEKPLFPLQVSAGAVFAPAEGIDFATLAKKAQQALAVVKKHGGQGCGVYRSEREETEDLRQGILRMQMSLGEKHYEPGAYWLDFAEFQIVYRFLRRLSDNYQTPIQFMQFRLPKSASRETAVEFKDMLIRTLRRSDCVTTSGRRHFLVALMQASPDDALLVEERIRSVWQALDAGMNCEYSFETDSIGG